MKAAIYCRLSEEDRHKQHETDESESIQNQKSMLLNYALEQNWEVYKIYSDDDYTGADRKRPEFNRLLEDARARRFDIVLCKTQSRFTRELELVEKYLHGLFPLWGIRFVSVVDNADTANKGNKKSRQINGLVNEWYLEDMSDNIKSVLIDKRKKGTHIGAFALYGYKKDPYEKGHLIIDEEAASIVQEVFTLFSEGYGKTAIARILNDRGIPNPTEYKRLHGLRYQQPGMKNSTLWKYPAISSMLENEIYIGNMVQGKYGSVSYKTKQNRPRPKSQWYRVEQTHEPIIDKALWTRVQELLCQRSRPFSCGRIGLFSGKALCSGCGYVMRSSKSHNRYYLQCPTHHIAKDACCGSFISVSALEQAVIAELNTLAAQYLDKDILRQSLSSIRNPTPQKEKLETELSACKKKKLEYENALKELYLDKARGILSQEDYITFSKSFALERKRLEAASAHCLEQLALIEPQIQNSSQTEQLPDAYTHLEQLNKETVNTMINCIYVGRRISGTQNVPVEIHWNF